MRGAATYSARSTMRICGWWLREVVMKFEDWLRTSARADVEVITDAPKLLAGAIARIAAARFEAGLAQDPAEIDANYVRRSDAELMWRDKV